MDIELKKSRGIKLLTKGKICEDDITITPKLKSETFTENGTYPIPEGFAGHGLITVDVKSSVSVTGVYTFNDSIVKTGAREFSSYDDTGYGEYISDVNNYIVCKNDDGTFSYILPVYVLAENIFLVFRHEGEIGEEAGSDIYYEDYNRESVDNQLSGLVVNINSAPSNLTEWILANATPESSGGGGECSGTHVIEVDELPTEDIDESVVYLYDGKYHKYASEQLVDVLVDLYGNGEFVGYVEVMTEYGLGDFFSVNTIPTKTTDGILVTDEDEDYVHMYYIIDEKDIFIFDGSTWISAEDWFGDNGGPVSDKSEATDTNCYYALLQGGWMIYQTVSGAITITENGTYDVSDKKSVSVMVSPPPVAIMVQTVADLPSDLPNGSLAYVLEG